MERIARFVYARARLIIILVAILNIAALVSFFRFELDTDFLSFFTSGNPRAEEFNRLKEKYETGEAISILIEQNDSLLEEENLQKLFRLREEIERLAGVSQVESFIPSEIPVGSRLFQLDEDFINRHADILEDFIKGNRFLTSQFLSADESKTVLVANLEFDAVVGEVVKSLEEVIHSEKDWSLSLAGDEIIKDTLKNYLIRIILILPPAAISLMILVSFMAIIIISVLYMPGLEVVSNQLMFFKKDSPIRQTFDKVEKYFGGALPLTAEIVSNRGVNTLRDYKFAEVILDIERELERLPGIESAFSPFDVVANINKMMTGREDYPENPLLIQRLLRRIDDEDLEGWFSDDGLRMMIRTDDLESLDIVGLEEFVTAHPEIRVVTGMPVLFNEMNKLVVESQIRSLGLAAALIFIMLLVTIRNLKAALVAMLPIVITIAAILGMLSITDFNLNIVTANLSAIAVGVGVDYAIHLISGIHYFQKPGLASTDPVDSALVSLSWPILANAFGLAIGLSVFFFSPLRIHTQVASIMWVAMVISSMGALLLIPLFYSRRNEPPEKANNTDPLLPPKVPTL